MRYLFAVALCGLLSAPTLAAEPITLRARTAGDLAALCAAPAGSPGADAKVNFCHGFAQGAIDDRFQTAGAAKPFCFPEKPPSRARTMGEFVNWVRATPANLDLPAIEGLFKFMAERFPCKS